MKNFERQFNTIETESTIETISKNVEKYFLPPLNDTLKKFCKAEGVKL